MKIEGSHIYYALLCDSGEKKDDMLICGVFGSKEEAKKVSEEINDCPAKHYIKKCKVTVEY